jgi:hypothetical protein
MLAEHLHPKTYWEKRCELAEESLMRLMGILARALPYQSAGELSDHLAEWNRLLTKLGDDHPASAAPDMTGGAT